MTQFGRALANAEEDAFLNGDGTGKPLGLFAAKGGGTVAETLTAAIKSDDLLSLIYALKRPYRRKASFILNDQTLASLRKLKDNNGAYIWQPSYQAGEPDRPMLRQMPSPLGITAITTSGTAAPAPLRS